MIADRLGRAIDAAIGIVSPRAGRHRMQARAAMRAYEAAESGRRGPHGRPLRDGSANIMLQRDLPRLRAASSDLVRNTAHGARMVEVMTGNLVGTGIRPVADTGSDRLDRQLMSVWEATAARADPGGVLEYYGLQALQVRSMIERGDVFRRRVIDRDAPRGAAPMQWQALEADCCDLGRDSIATSAPGASQRTRLGVELGEWDRRVGYWMFEAHPDESLVWRSTLVSAREVAHLFRPLRIGQVRGVPWLAPVLVGARDYADFLEATIVKARIEACFTAFVTTDDDIGAVTGAKAVGRDLVAEMEPGTLTRLKQGEDVKFGQPSANTSFDPVSIHMMQALAVGVGATFDELTGDLRQANYSSLRAGKVVQRRIIEQVQWQVLVPQLLQRDWDDVMMMATLAGIVRARAEGFPMKAVTPAFEPIDPKKDLEADILAVRAGRLSPQEFISAWGRDWREVVSDTAAFYAAVDAAGVVVDIDGRQPASGVRAAADAGRAAVQTDDAASD